MELAVPRPSPLVQTSRPLPVMPAFAGGTHAHTHTVDSALVCLGALGIGSARITLRRAGRDGHAAGTVVRQKPPGGTPLTPATVIQLDIAGLGFTQALPVGMWDSGGEAGAGTREILEPFDDPLEKLKHWFHEGAPLFHIAGDDLAACSRWLALFGMDARTWPESLWYPLASLIANMAQLSCSEAGCALVLKVLLGLPVQSFSHHPTLTALPGTALSRLGNRASTLGVDLLMGDAVEDLALLEIEIGPVPLDIYEQYVETNWGSALLARVLALLVPVSSGYEVRWSVEDRTQPPRLGFAGQNSRLGVNTHMGKGTLLAPQAIFGANV